MKVLFVQEQTFLATALKLTLLTKGYDLIVSDDTLSASTIIDAHCPNIVIADLSKRTGLLYVEEAKRKNVPVIVISKNGAEDELQKAFDKGADDYISMPLSITELALRVSILTKSRAVA